MIFITRCNWIRHTKLDRVCALRSMLLLCNTLSVTDVRIKFPWNCVYFLVRGWNIANTLQTFLSGKFEVKPYGMIWPLFEFSFNVFWFTFSITIEPSVNWKTVCCHFNATLLEQAIISLLKSFKIWNDKIAFHHKIDFIPLFFYKNPIQFSANVLRSVFFFRHSKE